MVCDKDVTAGEGPGGAELGGGCLAGTPAQVGVEQAGDLARLVAGGGNGIADQAAGPEAVEGGVEAGVADTTDQPHRGCGVGAGAAEDESGRFESGESAFEPLVAELAGEHQDAKAGAAQGQVQGLGVDGL